MMEGSTCTFALGPVERAAFRLTFAEPTEQLVVLIGNAANTSRLAREVESLAVPRQSDQVFRFLVIPLDESSGVCQGDERALSGAISYLAPWTFPLIPRILSLADVLVLSDTTSKQVIADAKGTLGATLCVVPGTIANEWSSVGLNPLTWDGEGARSLIDVLIKAKAPSEVDPRNTGATLLKRRSEGARPPAVKRIILQNDWGIGDELMLSAAAREVVRAHTGTQVWIRSRYGFRFTKAVRKEDAPVDAQVVEAIYQNPELYQPKAHSPFPGHLVQQMLDKVALDTGLVTVATDVRPELDLSRYQPEKTIPRSVVLHSGTNPRLPSKDWGFNRWRRVAEILGSSGVCVRQVGGKDERLVPGAEDLRGVPPCKLPAVFLGSSAVLCVVGFLMHLAEATRTPAVVIYGGREHPAIDGYPDQVHLSSEPLICRGRWGCHLGPDRVCPHGMKCMENLTPELVADRVLSVLNRGGKE